MPKQNGNPKILAAGAAVQLLTGIPAAWGVFQKPVMAQYGFSRGQAMLSFAILVAGYGIGCAIGGFVQDQHGPRYAALWGTALLGGGSMGAALVPQGNAALFFLVYSIPAGVGSAFLAPAVLACAQKWYASRKGLATGVSGAAMGLSGAFLTVFVGFVENRWGMRVCFAALGVVVLAAYCVLTCFYSGGAAVQPALNTDLFGLAHAGVNYGLIALGMSAGSLLSYAGSQLLDLPARHMLAVASAVAGGICFLFVKPVATVEKQQGNG